MEASVDVPCAPLQIVNSIPFVSFLYLYYPLSAPNPLSSPSPPSLLSLLINSLSSYDKGFNFHLHSVHQWHIFFHSVSHHDISFF